MRTRSAAIAALIALIVLAGGLAYLQRSGASRDTAATVPTTSPSATPATSISYAGVEGKNALDLLQEAHQTTLKDTAFGPQVMAIDGLAADDGHYWGFYVNGDFAAVGPREYATKATDQIEWRYQAL